MIVAVLVAVAVAVEIKKIISKLKTATASKTATETATQPRQGFSYFNACSVAVAVLLLTSHPTPYTVQCPIPSQRFLSGYVTGLLRRECATN